MGLTESFKWNILKCYKAFPEGQIFNFNQSLLLSKTILKAFCVSYFPHKGEILAFKNSLSPKHQGKIRASIPQDQEKNPVQITHTSGLVHCQMPGVCLGSGAEGDDGLNYRHITIGTD